MKRSSYFLVSATLSIALHAILILGADSITFRDITRAPSTKPRSMVIRMIDPRDRLANRPNIRRRINEESTRNLADAEKAAAKLKKLFEKEHLSAVPKPKLRLKGLGRDILAPKLPEPEKARAATAPRPKIIEIDANDISPQRLSARTSEAMHSKLARTYIPTKFVPSLLSPGSLSGGIGSTIDIAMRMGALGKRGAFNVGDLADDGLTAQERLNAAARGGFTPMGGIPGLRGIFGADKDPTKQGPIMINGERVMPLDEFVQVTVTLFQGRDGSGYYQAEISPNPRSEQLKDVPKDLLFLIDHSASISAGKLKQFKAGVIEAIEYLNPSDRFNVVSFTDRARPLFPEFMPYNADTKARGQAFVAKLARGGMTDVFGSLAPYVQASNSSGGRDRPLNLFLMTDGNSTVNIYDDDRFIQGIVKKNPGNVSIYSFSAGSRVNRELLDFLGYHNRGFNLHVAKLKQFKGTLVDYISSHSSLIVADLKYQANQKSLERDIFPKRLQHLYRGETLSFFGRFPAGTKEFVFRLQGRDGTGTLRALQFRRSLKECLRGSGELGRTWASQKVFHLIGERTLTSSPEAKGRRTREITKVAEKFGLLVPY
ncbi:MAG: VWA domain-containing protein [Lentisphaeria bacterium]|nr:VWA domain-containing protein [Lentisphaeria bacterium]